MNFKARHAGLCRAYRVNQDFWRKSYNVCCYYTELKKKKKPGSKTPQTSLPLTKANGVDEAKKSKAQLVFAMVQQSLQMYRIHCSVYPTTAIGLKGLEHSVKSCKSWRGPYIEAAQLIDPWGTRLSYTNEENIFILKSAGPDKKHGTADDL